MDNDDELIQQHQQWIRYGTPCNLFGENVTGPARKWNGGEITIMNDTAK